jgi:hypothetical protein
MFQSFTGVEYLKIDIANNFGLDKLNWDDRIHWFDSEEKNLANHIEKAKEPALFYAGIKAYYDVLKGNPIGYMISLDATASGLQILSCMTGDRLAARLCNVIPSGPVDNREDAYTLIYEDMCEQIGDSSKVKHEDVKQAIMTSLYGSTAIPKQVFGDGELLDVFYDSMKTLAPAAWELNEAYLNMWDSTALINEWVLPDNYHVKVKVMRPVRDTVHFLNEPFDVFYKVNAPVDQGRSLSANTTHSIDGLIVREMARCCDYDERVVDTLRSVIDNAQAGSCDRVTKNDRMVVTLWQHFKDTGYLSARIIDHLNSRNIGNVCPKTVLDLLETFPDKPFKLPSVHDCFRVLPHYGNDLRKQYNLQLERIAKSNLLDNLVGQLIGRPVSIGKFDNGLYRDIPNSNYALS